MGPSSTGGAIRPGGWCFPGTEPRRSATAAVLQRAVDRGELRPDIDIAAVMDQLYGPVYYRLTMGHEALTPGLADTLVMSLLDGIRSR